MACQLTISTAQIQQAVAGFYLLEDAHHTRLHVAPGGGERQGKGLVELPVELKQA